MRQWRNWQTRKIKDLVVVLDRGGSSPLCRTIIALGVSQVLFIAFKFALEKQERTFFEQIFNYVCSGFSINLVNFLVK